MVESYLLGSKIEQHGEEHETIAVLGDDAISDHRVALAQQRVHHRHSPGVAWSGQSRPQNRVRNQQGTWTSKPAPIGGVGMYPSVSAASATLQYHKDPKQKKNWKCICNDRHMIRVSWYQMIMWLMRKWYVSVQVINCCKATFLHWSHLKQHAQIRYKIWSHHEPVVITWMRCNTL